MQQTSYDFKIISLGYFYLKPISFDSLFKSSVSSSEILRIKWITSTCTLHVDLSMKSYLPRSKETLAKSLSGVTFHFQIQTLEG